MSRGISANRNREQIGIATLAAFAILGTLAIGLIVPLSGSKEWPLCELMVLTAIVVVAREYVRFARAPQQPFETTRIVPPPAPAAGLLSAPRNAKPTIHADWSVEEIARAMVSQSFRQAALQHHPDVGGDPEVMKRLIDARNLILRGLGKS